MRMQWQLAVLWGTAALAACSVKQVTFTELPVTIGGTITGVDGAGLVLTNNGSDDLTISGNGTFAFTIPLERGTSYAVAVKSQPSNPTQLCSVGSGTGTAGDGDVTDVQVSCRTTAFSVGGTVIGLVGSGLVLQNNTGDPLSMNADGTFTFAAPVASGARYDVTVAMQPSQPTQACTVNGGTGIVGASNVTNVEVTCATSAFTIGGTVTGLVGTGLVLQDNGGDDLAIRSDGSFTFATPVASGATFDVTVLTQPSRPTQICTVSGGAGTVGSGSVTSVAINCATNRYMIGGTISGLVGTVTLQNNGGDDLDVTSNGTFAFATSVLSGSAYSVTVKAQPTTPSQTCTVGSGSGMVGGGNVASVAITCTTNAFTIGGTVSGLAAGDSITLRDNGGDDLVRSANGSFTFATPVASGQPYVVTIVGNPAAPVSQTCTVGSGTGVVGGSNVTSVTVTCTTNAFTIGGTVSGLAAGDSITLRDNGGDDLVRSANGSFTFTTAVASGQPYAVTIVGSPTSPISQTCTVGSGAGTVGGGNVTSVTVTCTTNAFTIGGTVSGLAAGDSITLRDNGGDDLVSSANGSFTFATPVASGQPYAVTIVGSPTSPISQTCTVGSGAGVVGSSNVTDVVVTCTTNAFTIGGTISGLVGTVTLRNNGGDDLAVTVNGTFAFSTVLLSGATYAVTVQAQPVNPWQTCTVAAGAGTVTNADVTSIAVTCTTNRHRIGGVVSGLGTGNSITLRNNGGDDLVLTTNGNYTFQTPIASGQGYRVTLVASPTAPISQTCTVLNGNDVVFDSDITIVFVMCTTNRFTIGGTVSGLTGTGLVLQDDGFDNLAISGNGAFTFPTSLPSGAPYAVTVTTQPSGQTCTVTNGTGTLGASNVTNVQVTCSVRGAIFSAFFFGGQTPNAQCASWNTFLGELIDSSYSSVTISGTFDTAGVTCSDPVIATQICQALHNSTSSISVFCNGHTWNVGNCGGRELSADGSTCVCDFGYVVRPCIPNLNWGGVNTQTCNAPSQNITVSCQ